MTIEIKDSAHEKHESISFQVEYDKDKHAIGSPSDTDKLCLIEEEVSLKNFKLEEEEVKNLINTIVVDVINHAALTKLEVEMTEETVFEKSVSGEENVQLETRLKSGLHKALISLGSDQVHIIDVEKEPLKIDDILNSSDLIEISNKDCDALFKISEIKQVEREKSVETKSIKSKSSKKDPVVDCFSCTVV